MSQSNERTVKCPAGPESIKEPMARLKPVPFPFHECWRALLRLDGRVAVPHKRYAVICRGQVCPRHMRAKPCQLRHQLAARSI